MKQKEIRNIKKKYKKESEGLMYLDIRDLRKSFGQGESRTEVLRGISFGVEKGKICVLVSQTIWQQ